MILGIDAGTTSISIVVFDEERQTAAEVLTLKNDAAIQTGVSSQYLQDPGKIVDIVLPQYEKLAAQYPIRKIGVTGQMHGILFLDAAGNAASPLYTWQNENGEHPYQQGKSYRAYLSDRTGYALPENIALGSVTHFFLEKTNGVPRDAVKLCTIGDYIVMRLCGLREPVMHISNADGMGLFDLSAMRLDTAAIEKAELDPDLYPVVKQGFACAGLTRSGIPVATAIGDNQAGYFGAVGYREDSLLLNIGTSSQISCLSREIVNRTPIETRAFLDNDYLTVSTAHCGGRAYAALEHFFRQVVELAGFEPSVMYDVMNNSVAGWKHTPNELVVNTAFRGTRANPAQRGEIANITLSNFTPQHLVHGFLWGMAMELFPAFHIFAQQRRFSELMTSGNAIRKNPVFQEMLQEAYELPVRLAPCPEEAAYGAAMFAAHMA